MVDTLPPAPWTKRADLAGLVAALGKDNARWVGGAVRDTLLGQPVKDIDCATPLEPLEVIRRLTMAGIRSVPTGIDHGTVTAVLPEGPVEITTLRRDVSTDGRRATVKYATDWQEDAARRDFTINALYVDPSTLEIFDYFGGIGDLDRRLVRFIGDARDRIREDHLRILRYYRFQARFGAMLDGEAEEACAELAPTLKGLSRERVAAELLNLLALPEPLETIARMHERGVLHAVLPETTRGHLAALSRLIASEQSSATLPDPIRRLAALLPPSPPVALEVAARLRLSKSQRVRLAAAAGRHAADSDDPLALAYREGKVSAIDRLLIEGKSIDALQGWDVPTLPLKGGEIVERGISEGPAVARILREVEARWLEEGFPPRERVLEILEQFLADSWPTSA
ncbi:MAG TPA: CCA tRNA nucleotidyltransferase [Sphingomonadaceae bacterium]|nr:CCA tRNA nucleotidyltransferase [Sphingomonadaceae bacterium]